LAPGDGQVVTLDTNIAVYALTRTDKRLRARDVLRSVGFLSVQVLNEYANVAKRKLGRDWETISDDLASLRNAAGRIKPISDESNNDAARIAARYNIAFYDAVMIAVALANGATTLYSEDMQHGMVIDGTLTITDPFLSTETI
jgi:predicted nucleic acid-binding protein